MHVVTFVVIAAAAAASRAENFIEKRGGGRTFMPIGKKKKEPIAISNDEKRGGAQPYGKERWHNDLTFLVDERSGGELPKDLRQAEYLARPEHPKRGGGRKFGAHKRGGARLFAPAEQQDDARVFTAEKINVNAFSPVLQQNGVRAFIEGKKGGGGAFIYEKKGGARMFRGSKRDYADEYPDWLIYEDTPLFKQSERENGEERMAFK